MKKPTDQAYTTYRRYMDGEKIDDIAFDLDISHAQAYKNIERVREYEHYNNYPKMAELVKSDFRIYYLNGALSNTNNVKLHILYDVLFTLYLKKVVELKCFQSLGMQEIVDEINKETDGFDVVINLEGWEARNITHCAQKLVNNIEDINIDFWGEHCFKGTIKAFRQVEFKDKILKVNFSEEMQDKVLESLNR